MRVAYYAVGLYLVRLCQEFLDGYAKNNKHIQAYYGGDLRYDDDKILLNPNRLVYYKYYQTYKKTLRSLLRHKDRERMVVLKIDVQNYFDNISVLNLTRLIQRHVKPTEQKRFRFFLETQNEIVSFFDFVSQGKTGIPQSDNDLISNYIGHLYLTFGDLLIDDQIKQFSSLLADFTITRFVDDTFIALAFNENVSETQVTQTINSLLERISHQVYSILGLKLNRKTEIFHLSIESDRDRFLRQLKRVSARGVYSTDSDEELSPLEKLEEVFSELEKLKTLDNLSNNNRLDTELLKDVFEKPMQQLLEREETVGRLDSIFKVIDLEQLKLAPQELLILLFKSKECINRLTSYLFKKNFLSIRDIDLLLLAITITEEEVERKQFLSILRKDFMMKPITEMLAKPDCLPNTPGYFALNRKQCATVSKFDSRVLKQASLRVRAETTHSYALALSHLLNEFQSIVACLYRAENGTLPKTFDSNALVNYLVDRNVPHVYCVSARNLFDRRHINLVSHAGIDEIDAWNVNAEEYETYKDNVGKCLAILLR